MKDLVVKYDYKSYIDFNLSSFITLPSISTYHSPHFLSAISVQISNADYWPMD